jgi:hypothetical protein
MSHLTIRRREGSGKGLPLRAGRWQLRQGAPSKAVHQFQTTRSLDGDGRVGLQTWTALLGEQPPTSSNE